MIYFLYLDATSALNRILKNLDENSEIYENAKAVKLVLESPLFINLYNIQNKMKLLNLENISSTECSNKNNLLSVNNEIKKNYYSKTIINDTAESSIFRLIKLERAGSLQTFGFTIILIEHPHIDNANETFVFVQDVEENSIAS